jgi:hypothetical protein
MKYAIKSCGKLSFFFQCALMLINETDRSEKMADRFCSSCRQWAKRSGQGDGILVGSDLTQEWILPWWWENYKHFNSHPVVFIDLGMSFEMKAWCKERGKTIRLFVADVFVAEKDQIDSQRIDEWEGRLGKTVWPSRNGWFKKPTACLQTPFNRSIWIDLDCEIRGPLSALFELADHPSGIAMARENHEVADQEPLYNSGVIAFRYGTPLFEKWADDAFDRNHLFAGDQNALSHQIFEEEMIIGEVPQIYNWSRLNPENPDAIILHWHGVHGKSEIAHQIWKEKGKNLIVPMNS